jgi:hypothetical protein
LADYFRGQAAWRETKAMEYPGDQRNANAKTALSDLAQYLEKLDDEDPRIIAVTAFARVTGMTDLIEFAGMEGGPDLSPAPGSRIGFGERSVNLDRELTWYVEANLAEWVHRLEVAADEEYDPVIAERIARLRRRAYQLMHDALDCFS